MPLTEAQETKLQQLTERFFSSDYTDDEREAILELACYYNKHNSFDGIMQPTFGTPRYQLYENLIIKRHEPIHLIHDISNHVSLFAQVGLDYLGERQRIEAEDEALSTEGKS